MASFTISRRNFGSSGSSSGLSGAALPFFVFALNCSFQAARRNSNSSLALAYRFTASSCSCRHSA